jgi:hypothetical protein
MERCFEKMHLLQRHLEMTISMCDYQDVGSFSKSMDKTTIIHLQLRFLRGLINDARSRLSRLFLPILGEISVILDSGNTDKAGALLRSSHDYFACIHAEQGFSWTELERLLSAFGPLVAKLHITEGLQEIRSEIDRCIGLDARRHGLSAEELMGSP